MSASMASKLAEWAAANPLAAGAAAAAAASASLLLVAKVMGKAGSVLTITVPATTANLACGFDAFGAAFELRMALRSSPAPPGSRATRFSYTGEGAAQAPTGEDNLIWRSALACARMHAPGRDLPKLLISVHNPVPFGRGLGSSATAIIAGVMLANEQLGLGLTHGQLLDAALEMENHPDNLAPALYGGAVASGVGDDGRSMVRPFGINRQIKAVVLIPEFEVETEKARQVLPTAYSRADAVYNVQRVGLLPLALSSRTLDVRLVRECMKDRLHQQYRAPLIPGLVECLDLPNTSSNPNLIATALSGAGPTILSLGTGDLRKIGSLMSDCMASKGVKSRILVLPFAHTGATARWSMW